ncbi:MAG: helix-turn-helix domain-containing protein [Alphaproteobacteria bacterium]|nr:helix-turn-helix domain-containing protein [Alphaproteobacteria bacterium]
MEALLWGFHNSKSGCCFPSYEAIAAKAECARSTVADALKALEWAGVLTHLAAAHHPRPRAPARPIRPLGEPLAGHPYLQRLHVPRSPGAAAGRFFLIRRTFGPEQPLGASLAATRGVHRRKIADEWVRCVGPGELTGSSELYRASYRTPATDRSGQPAEATGKRGQVGQRSGKSSPAAPFGLRHWELMRDRWLTSTRLDENSVLLPRGRPTRRGGGERAGTPTRSPDHGELRQERCV